MVDKEAAQEQLKTALDNFAMDGMRNKYDLIDTVLLFAEFLEYYQMMK